MTDPGPPRSRLVWTLRHRRTTLLLCVAVMLMGIASAFTLTPGTAVRDMLPAQSPAAAAMDRVLTDFRLIDDLMVLVEPALQDDTDHDKLRAFAERFAAAMNQEEDVAYVRFDRGETIARTKLLNDLAWSQAWSRLNDDQRRGLRERLTPNAMRTALEKRAAELAAPGARPAAWRDALADDPLGLLRWLEESSHDDEASRIEFFESLPTEDQADLETDLALGVDGRSLLIRIGGTRPANDLPYSQALVRRTQAAIKAANTDELLWQLTGPHAIANYSASSTKRDMVVSMVVSLGLITFLFFVVYRDHRTLPITLLTVNGGIVVAFGLYALGRGQLSPVTATCGAVLAGLGIDYCVHLLAHARSRKPEDLGQAMRRMTPILGAACVTSAIGFAAVGASGVRALTEFAVLGVLGLACTLAMTLTFLPAALASASTSVSTPSEDKGAPDASDNRLSDWLIPLVSALFSHSRRWLFLTAMTAGMAASWLLLIGTDQVRFASDLEAMHAVPNPPLEAQALITERFAVRPSVLFVHLDADDPASLLNRAQTLNRSLRDFRKKHPHLYSHFDLGMLLSPPIPQEAEPKPDAKRTLADFDAAVADSPFRAESFSGFRTRLATALNPAERPDWNSLRGAQEDVEPVLPRSFFNGSAANQSLAVLTLDTPWELLEEREALLSDLRLALAKVPGSTLTGLAVVGAEMQEALAGVTERLVWIAGVSVIVWLCVFFRNPWEVMAALFPAVLGLLVLAALIGLTGIELHAANLIALPLTLGLGVDDGIFLVAVARRVRRSQGTVQTLQRELATAAAAIVITSLTTLLAFGSLAFTRTPAIESLGLLSAVGIVSCLLASLFGLIPILAMSHTGRRRATPSHGTA
ncbi:MAG: MMPL family transporter [Planctomycetota bacterium]